LNVATFTVALRGKEYVFLLLFWEKEFPKKIKKEERSKNVFFMRLDFQETKFRKKGRTTCKYVERLLWLIPETLR
jgi:hypothetical protein